MPVTPPVRLRSNFGADNAYVMERLPNDENVIGANQSANRFVPHSHRSLA
jgi:hypothetical protein